MPVHLFASAVSSSVPTEYWASIAASLVAISFLKTWSKGAKLLDPPLPPPPPRPSSSSSSNSSSPTPPQLTPDDLFTDLHGRVILVASGAFTPVGVVTLSALAHRGAQIIALTPDISSPDVIQIIQLIRDSTRSELIYAEQCDMASLQSISAFAALWNAGDNKQQGVRRLDAILFLSPSRDELDRVQLIDNQVQADKIKNVRRIEAIYQLHVLARFHLVNSLLSSLLVLPPDREIRIVSVISPYYAAGMSHFDVFTSTSAHPNNTVTTSKGKTKPKIKASPSTPPQQQSMLETMAQSSYSALVGAASLRWYALTIELQRRLDLLAEADPRPRTKLPGIELDSTITSTSTSTTSSIHTASTEAHQKASKNMRQHSNISIINVCPGFERNIDIIETFFPSLNTPCSSSTQVKGHWIALIYYLIRSLLRWTLLILLWPLIWLLTKSPATVADSIVWATTRNLESNSSRYHRILSSLSLSLSSNLDPQHEETHYRRWQDNLIPAQLYREGRIIRPQLPIRFTKHHHAWSQLWKIHEDQVENRIKALGGQIKRPNI